MLKFFPISRFDILGAVVFGIGALLAALLVWSMIAADLGGGSGSFQLPGALAAAVIAAIYFGGFASGRMSAKTGQGNMAAAVWTGIAVTAKSYIVGIVALSTLMALRSLVTGPSLTMLGASVLSIFSFLVLGLIVAGPIIFPVGALLGGMLELIQRVIYKRRSESREEHNSKIRFHLGSAAVFGVAMLLGSMPLRLPDMVGNAPYWSMPLAFAVLTGFFLGGLMIPGLLRFERPNPWGSVIAAALIVTVLSYLVGVLTRPLVNSTLTTAWDKDILSNLGELLSLAFLEMPYLTILLLPLGILAGVAIELWNRQGRASE